MTSPPISRSARRLEALRRAARGTPAHLVVVPPPAANADRPWVVRLAARLAELFRRVETRTSLRERDP
jgi:hypothetical protein